MTKEFLTGCIHMMMDTCGIREYRIEDGADKPLLCRFHVHKNTDLEYLKEKLYQLIDYVEFVTDWY